MYRELEGSSFVFKSKNQTFTSSDYKLVFANLDTTALTNLHGHKQGVYVFNKRNNKRYLVGEDYTQSPLDIEIEILTEDGKPISETTRTNIHNNLFFPISEDFGELYLYDCEGKEKKERLLNGSVHSRFLRVKFSNPSAIETDAGIVGYRVTLETDSNMYWVGPITTTYQGSTSTIFSITNYSDTTEPIYPRLVITTVESASDIDIYNQNNTLSNLFLRAVPSYSRITIDGSINYISGNYHEKVSKWNFPKIYRGSNTMVFRGVSKVEMTHYEKRAIR